MKKDFIPYYISRFILSMVVSILVWHFTWMAALMTFIFFGLFLLYLHSGWFSIDLSTPSIPCAATPMGRRFKERRSSSLLRSACCCIPLQFRYQTSLVFQ